MKKIILLIAVVASVSVAQAQRKFKKGDYLKSTYVDQFVGTWEWKSGNDSFTIKFKKIKYHESLLDIDEDRLQGWFKYVKDGKVIENSIADRGKDSSSTAVASEFQDPQQSLLVSFTDINTKVTSIIFMTLMPSDKRKAIWSYRPSYPSAGKAGSNSIPVGDKWIMEKIK